MFKHRYLIGKHHWKSRKTFRGLCVCVFRYRVKNVNVELAESFLHHVLSQVRLPEFQEKGAKAL